MAKHKDACVPLTMARTLPEKANVVVLPLYMPSSLRCPMFSWTAAWSLAVINLFVHALHHNNSLEKHHAVQRIVRPQQDNSRVASRKKPHHLRGMYKSMFSPSSLIMMPTLFCATRQLRKGRHSAAKSYVWLCIDLITHVGFSIGLLLLRRYSHCRRS